MAAPIYLKVEEIAELLQVNKFNVYRLCGHKKIPYLKIPGVGLRFRLSDIEKWLSEYERPIEDINTKIQEWRHNKC